MARHYMRDVPQDPEEDAQPERSIRDLRPSAARRKLQPPRPEQFAEYEVRPQRSRKGMWIAAGAVVLVLAGAAFLVLVPMTTISITARTQIMTFDGSNPFTAYPEASAATGTIPYSIFTQSLEDSAIVQASGTEQAEEKATGSVTVYNETNRAMRLIKNTRFQTPSGLIFRAPESVDVPPMSGSPGSMTITVFADQTGPSYNIGPIDRFTLPGLKSSPDYEKVYAKSTAAFTGGFSGERPAVSASVLEGAKADVRSRLTEKAQLLATSIPEGSVAFPGLMAISFESLPPTNEPGGGVRINERATIVIPIFAEQVFAGSVAQAVSANAEGQKVSIRFADGIMGQFVGTTTIADIGTQAITFALSGRGQLMWDVDASGLAEALSGREEAAFETIVKGFPAVEEARAKISPFWRRAFPQDPSDIKIVVEEPPQF